MKIQPISFPLNIGTATDLEINAVEYTETTTSVNVHFHLIDLVKTTMLVNNVELPYRIVYANNFILDGVNFLNYKENPSTLNTLVANMIGVTLLSSTV